MPSVKITELPVLGQLSANNANTVFVAVDKTSNTTSQFPTNILAAGLFANNVLNVGTEIPSVFPGLVAQFIGNTAPYSQINFENANTIGSMDVVITADIGDDANNYLDLGVNNSGYEDPLFSATKAADGYLFMHGSPASTHVGNLVIGTAETETNVVFSVGGTTNLDVVAKMTRYGLAFDNGGYITFNDGSIQTVAAGDPAIALSAQANTIITQGIDLTQNTRLNSIETINNNQNTAISIIQGVDFTQNTNITTANNHAWAAFDKANNALANTTGTFAGDLTITGGLTVANTINGSNVSITNRISFTSNATIRTASGNDNEKDILILTGDEIATDNGGAITIQTGAGTATGRGGDINLIGGLGGYGRGRINLLGDTDVGQRLTVNGTVVFANSNFSATEAAVTISASGIPPATPANDGYMIHISGKNGVPSRVVTDSYGTGAYVVYTGRSARGTLSSPTALQANDVIARYSSSGYGTTKYQPFGVGRIDFVASENYTDANTGSRIELWNCPNQSNTLQKIASFNGDSVEFTGTVQPDKGFIYVPTVLPGNQTAFTINFATTSLIKAELIADLTISLSNFVYGKVVEVWLTNTSGNQRTVTHGCTSTNSSTNSTTFNMSATSSAYLRYFSIDGDLANTFVTVQAA